MPSYRFPILVWQHSHGGCTACLIEDDENVAAVGATAVEAVRELKDLLQRRYRQEPGRNAPNFSDPVLSWLKVDVRPEYQADKRLFPSRQTFPLRLPCVRGKDRAGLKLCSLPTLGVRFTYDDDAEMAQLAGHYVQMQLKSLTPQQLARHLPPAHVQLDDLAIVVPRQAAVREAPPDLNPLPLVAEALGGRQTRRMLSRPWQRDAQVERLGEILGAERASVLLLGESGVGKTAVLVEAVRKVERGDIESAKEDAPDLRIRNRFWQTSAAGLIAGMKYLGQWQERVEELIEVLRRMDGVLCVDNLLDLVRTGGVSPNDSLAAFLIPYIQRGELRLVGEATSSELDACRRLLPSFAVLFTVVEIPSFGGGQAIDALDQLANVARQNLKIEYNDDAVRQIYRLFARFMPYHGFPGRAAAFTTDLFDRIARAKGSTVTSQSVIGRFIKLTGLPELFLRDDRVLKFEEVVSAFERKVIGQKAACRQAAGVITTFKAGLNDPHRPLGVLLFCGPTGVGKTELARTISEFLFGQGEKTDRLVRLDMSEYAGPGAAERLIGSPNGEPSALIKRLRDQPFTVVLLDEIEKASADVFDVLLGVFDEGRLTDHYGRLTTFRSSLIIMTSNLGADRMEPFGLSHSPASDYDTEATSFFRPEFFNRIDAVVTFTPLSEHTIREITLLELGRISDREGLKSKGVRLDWTEDVIQKLCSAGYDRRYGARPLQRAIEMLVVTPLARYLVGHPGLGDATVLMHLAPDGTIEFES